MKETYKSKIYKQLNFIKYMKNMPITATSGTISTDSNVEITESNPKTFFYYGTKTENRKNKTITRRVAYAGIQITGNAIRLGKATCSLKDSFVKKKARAIALGRAKGKPEDILYLTDDAPAAKQFVARVSGLLDPKPIKAVEAE